MGIRMSYEETPPTPEELKQVPCHWWDETIGRWCCCDPRDAALGRATTCIMLPLGADCWYCGVALSVWGPGKVNGDCTP